ncbi:MAG: hypothetical protein PVI57_10265 [Gemmatimonadota bacterium]
MKGRGSRGGGRSGRPDFTTSGLVALAVAALLAALSLVTWRQSRALESLAELDSLRRERSLARAEIADLDRRIQYLESRTHIVPEARARLDMHVPSDEEIVHLMGDVR